MAFVVNVDLLERDAVLAKNPLAVDPLPDSYRQIKNLVWLKHPNTPPVYKEALEEWERTSKLLAFSIERKTKQSESLKSEIYNLVGFYSVFQGVVLTAVSQSEPKVLTCKKFWIPVILSVLASLVGFVGIWRKHRKIQDLDDNIDADKRTVKELDRRDADLRKKGKDFRFASFREEKAPKKIASPQKKMVKLKTDVVNETDMKIELKEARHGVSEPLKTLYPKNSRDGSNTWTMKLDPYATYREYVMLLLPHENRITLTSDDVIDYKTVRIKYDTNKPAAERLQWIGTSRNTLASAATPGTQALTVPASGTQAPPSPAPTPGFLPWIKAFVGLSRPKLKEVPHNVKYIEPANAANLGPIAPATSGNNP